MVVNETTGDIAWVPDATQTGTYRAVLQVSDGRGGTATQDIFVSTTLPTVIAKNTAPVFLTPSLLDYHKIDFEGKNYRGQNLYVSFADNPNINLGGVPFLIGPQGGNNYWRSFETGLPNPRTNAFPVRVDGALQVETLINTGWGAPGPQSYACIEFFGSKGAYYRKDLIGNEDIRNWNTGDGNFTRFINNTTTTLVYGFDYFGTFRAMDKQRLALPVEFQDQGLDSMRIVDNGGDGFQRTFLGGVSVLAPGAREGATIQAGIPFAYTFSAQDAEQSQLTYTLVSGPAGATLNATTGLLTWTPAATLSGWYPVVLRAADGQGGTAELNLTLRVQPEVYNYAPKITSQPLTKVRFGSTYRSLVQVYDPNGDPISFQLTQAPAGMTLVTRDGSATSTGATGYLSWTPTAGQVGSHAVTVQVTDGRSAPVTQTFTAQVLGSRENISPAITSRPPLVAVIGRTYSYDIVAGDADQDALLYRPDTTANTVNGTKPIIPVGASVNPLRGTVRWVPSEDQIGLQRIAIEVIDQQGGATRQEWEVLVQGVNQPPIFASVPPTEAAANVSYTYAPTVSDPEGDKLAYTLSAAPAGMTISPTTGVITWLPASVTSTPQTVTVRASDGFGGIAEQTYGVIVRSALRNLPPVITASTVTGVEPGATFTHTVLATDPEGTALTWSLLQKPAAMQIAPGTGEIAWATTAADLGQHAVTVLVTDAGGASTSQTFIVSVTPNQIPSVGNTAPVTTELTGTAYASWFDVTDGNGDALTYRIIDGPPGLTIDSTGHITWTTPSAPGSYDIVLAASDGRGGEIRQIYTLVTTSDSTLPQVSLIAQYNVVKVGEVVRFQAFATDNDLLADLVLTVDGTAVPMDASHIVT